MDNGREPVALTSTEKVARLMQGVSDSEPETEEDARLMQMFQVAAPFASRVIPDDPAELDRMLLSLARWAISLRSDGGWHPTTIADLFDGPPEPEQEEPNDASEGPRDADPDAQEQPAGEVP